MAGSITTLGLGSSLDLQGIIDQLKEADRAPITTMEARQLQYKDQLAEFEVVNGKLLTMKSVALALSLNDSFDTKSATSSQADVLTAIADSSAKAGTHELTVDNLVKRNVWQSDGVASASASIASAAGNFEYTVDGTTYSVAVTNGMTLQQLASAINDDEDNPGITASVMDDGDNTGVDDFHLLLTSDETGVANAITTDDVDNTNDTSLSFTSVQSALDAQVTINAVTYKRAGNSIDDIISGVTLDLVSAGTSTVLVTDDTESVKDKIFGLVAAYNDVAAEIKANSGVDDETGVEGSLFGVSAFRSLGTDIYQLMSTPVDGLSTAYGNLSEIGLLYQRDGSLKIDEDVLDAALANNLEDVKGLFVGDSADIDGVASLLEERLASITTVAGGLISYETARVQAAVDQLDDQIDIATKRLDARYELMTKQFVQLDQLLSTLDSEGSFLTDQFKNLSGMWKTS